MKITNEKKQDKEKKLYEMNLDQRLIYLKRETKLSERDIDLLRNPSSFTFLNADRMV